MGNFNYKRKLFHLLGFILPYLYYIDIFNGAYGLSHASRAIIFSILMFQGFVLITTETLRLKNDTFKAWFATYFGSIMKKEEETRMNATIPYMLSNAIVVLFFPPEFYFFAIGYLLIGDPVAAFFGANYGKFRFYNGKSLVGVVAFIIAACLVGIIFMVIFQNTKEGSLFALFTKDGLNSKALVAVVISAIVAGLTEFFSGHAWNGFLDDNLTIPLSAAFTLALALVLFFGISGNEIFFPVTELFAKNGFPRGF
ncbi:MAG: dolichol kinase [Leptospiraceae bacterium]|nr:dolichol kinase [Leptospiraceae bacterium]